MAMWLIIYSICSLLHTTSTGQYQEEKIPLPGEELGIMRCRADESSGQLQFGLLLQQCGIEVLKTAAVHLVSSICRLVFGSCNQ